jgi:beta-glucosidase/6-phospho-beta-glucosidase/beta-galactosidase
LADLKKSGLDSSQFICGYSCDSYNFWAEDLKAIKELNLNSYRFGLEWAVLSRKTENSTGKPWNIIGIF